MKLSDFVFAYFDVFEGKYQFLVDLHDSDSSSDSELLRANNQFLSDLMNAHAHSNLLSQYVSLYSHVFDEKIARVFGDIELVREIIKVGSNLSDYFGYCGFCSDSMDIHDGFSLVIDRNNLAFSHNDIHSMSDLISKNIRFRKVEYVSTKFDPSYQLPTYSLFGVQFHVVPDAKIQYPFVEF